MYRFIVNKKNKKEILQPENYDLSIFNQNSNAIMQTLFIM